MGVPAELSNGGQLKAEPEMFFWAAVRLLHSEEIKTKTSTTASIALALVTKRAHAHQGASSPLELQGIAGLLYRMRPSDI